MLVVAAVRSLLLFISLFSITNIPSMLMLDTQSQYYLEASPVADVNTGLVAVASHHLTHLRNAVASSFTFPSALYASQKAPVSRYVSFLSPLLSSTSHQNVELALPSASDVAATFATLRTNVRTAASRYVRAAQNNLSLARKLSAASIQRNLVIARDDAAKAINTATDWLAAGVAYLTAKRTLLAKKVAQRDTQTIAIISAAIGLIAFSISALLIRSTLRRKPIVPASLDVKKPLDGQMILQEFQRLSQMSILNEDEESAEAFEARTVGFGIHDKVHQFSNDLYLGTPISNQLSRSSSVFSSRRSSISFFSRVRNDTSFANTPSMQSLASYAEESSPSISRQQSNSSLIELYLNGGETPGDIAQDSFPHLFRGISIMNNKAASSLLAYSPPRTAEVLRTYNFPKPHEMLPTFHKPSFLQSQTSFNNNDLPKTFEKTRSKKSNINLNFYTPANNASSSNAPLKKTLSFKIRETDGAMFEFNKLVMFC